MDIDIFAILSFVIPLFIYLLTLAPSVTFFDSGEFITAIYSLGTAHSPGYPLFVNFVKPFTYLPFGNIAFRVNFATAVSAALACYGVYLLVSHFLAQEELWEDRALSAFFKKGVALCASLLFAFTARLWLQSNHDKPYPLISFMAAMVFYLLVLWREKYQQGEERPHYVYLGAFLVGLAFGAHQTIVLMLPVYAFLILSLDWRLAGRFKEIVFAAVFALFGFSIHLHMPIRALKNPLLNWGDPKTLTLFLWNFLRKGYPVEKPDRTWALLWEQVQAFNISHEFTLGGLLLLLLCFIAYRTKRRDEITAYLVGVIFFLTVIIGYLNTPLELIFLTEEFFTPLYLLTSVFIGLGLFSLLKGISSLPAKEARSLPVMATIGLVLLALPVTLCLKNFHENDQHENYIAYDYAGNTFRSLPQGAALFTWGDSGAFPLWYLQGVEKMREDLDLLHTPHLVFIWYLDAFPHLFANSLVRQMPEEQKYPDVVLKLAIAEQLQKRPVYIDFSTRYSIPFEEYTLRQQGICYKVDFRQKNENAVSSPDPAAWRLYNERGLKATQMVFRDLDTTKALLIYGNSRLEVGDYMLRHGMATEGMEQMRLAVEISPQLKDQVDQMISGLGK